MVLLNPDLGYKALHTFRKWTPSRDWSSNLLTSMSQSSMLSTSPWGLPPPHIICVIDNDSYSLREGGQKYVFTQPLWHGQDVTQGQFLNGLKLNCIQNFPSLRLVAKLMLRKPFCPTVYPARRRTDEFILFQSAKWYSKNLVQDLNSGRRFDRWQQVCTILFCNGEGANLIRLAQGHKDGFKHVSNW